jgi:RNA polymerase sigma-70 factor (TIGR02960 family)
VAVTVEHRAGFDAATEGLRGELTAHCYRMLGSWDDAQDAVQDTYLRAWRAWDGFEHRSSVRTWMYRIAGNVCLTAAQARGRRAVPTDLGATGDAAGEPVRPQLPTWLQPYPGDRDDVRLAMIAGLQALPPAQRAVLLLRDVLAFPAAEVAQLLETTTPAVKSTLQRARARLARCELRPEDVAEPSSPAARRQLEAYLTAFETADIRGLAEVLRADACLDLVASGEHYSGLDACLPVFTAGLGRPGEWRMEPVVANGQPAVRVHRHGRPYGIAVLDVRRDGLAGVAVFDGAGLVARFAPG